MATTEQEPVQARCHIFPPKALQRDLDLAWSSAETRVEEAAGSLKEAIQMIEEDSYTFGPRSLQSKKGLLVRKLLDKLLSASSQMHQLHSQFVELKETLKSLQRKLKATEKAHMEVLHQMEVLSSDVQVGTKELPEESSPRDRILNQIPLSKNIGLHELSQDENAVIRPQIRSEAERIRDENIKLKQDIQRLAKEKEDKAVALETAEANSACAVEQIEKHKEVIARTTADNMLFLMKLKQTEENLQAAKSKQEELQKQLELYRSTWLEEASAEIEDAVKGSLDKAQACEVELRKIRTQQESRMRECEQKLRGLTESLNALSGVKQNLEQRVKALEEERTNLLCRMEKEASERHYAETQSRVLVNNMEKTNTELARLKEQYEGVLEEMKAKTEDLDSRQDKENQLLQSLESVSSQLEVQRVMNSALMKKKEEVEWICLEAQAEREKLKQQLRDVLTKQAERSH